MPDSTKGRGPTKCTPSSSRLGVGREVNDSFSEKCTVTKPWRRPRLTKSCSASKEEEEAGNVRERNMVLELFVFLSKRLYRIEYLVGSVSHK
jgi:hypothetical protein